MKKVTLYSTPTCPYCQMTKVFFKEKGIQYTDIDVSADQKKAEEMIKKSGQMGVPVTVITDQANREQIIIGFDQPALTKALGF